ncbi:ABC-2 type transporter-domain-containing protein [Chytriomyces sp. MP71]|nr:ABC-2 type transporter-domain-containing protein [Chytriomyces sp. MP71]
MAAKLRRPDLSEIEQVSTVDDIIAGLNLKNAENTIIGDAQIKGVSGGERKRCSMAMEMITNPPILFLDEPTSGLDSFTALSVIKTLKALAETGRTIVITIHQPSSEVFRLFDDLILMADGRILYQGVAERSVQYFSNLGYACPLRSNPSDFFFMSILNTDEAIESADGIEPRERIERLLNTWPEQVEYEALLKVMDSRRYNRNILLTSERHLSSIWVQFIFLYARSTKNAVRNPLVLRSKLAQTLFTSFLIGFLYYQTNLKTDTSAIQNRLGVIFFLSNGNYMSSQTSNLSVFGREKSNFKREYDLGYYSVGPYFLAKILSELPLYVLFPGLETLLIYYLAGLQTSGAKVVVAICASCLLSLLGMAVGVTIAVSTSSLQMALLVVPMLTIPLMLFSGMFLNLNSIVPALSWFQWLSPIRYCFEALVKNEFDGLNLDLAIEISGTAYKKTVQGSSIITQEGFGLDGLSVGQLLAILACSCVVFFLVSYVLLVRLVTKRSIFKSQ